MNQAANLKACRAARVPKSGLALLAPLRCLTTVQVVEVGEHAWITWQGESSSMVNALMTIEGSRLYCPTGSNWRMLGQSLPDLSVPAGIESIPLDCAVVPAPLSPVLAPSFRGMRVAVTLVACGTPRQTTAIKCGLKALEEWCNRATTAEIEGVSGVWNGSRVWLRGQLPVLAAGERFWGRRVLVPLGSRPEPDWPEAALRKAAIVDDDEILVLTHDGPEVIGLTAFQPLSRAKIRRMLQTNTG